MRLGSTSLNTVLPGFLGDSDYIAAGSVGMLRCRIRIYVYAAAFQRASANVVTSAVTKRDCKVITQEIPPTEYPTKSHF